MDSLKRSPAFSVALPVYNEAGILDQLHALLTKACSAVGDDYQILYVDDGSRDRTPEVLAALAADDPHVTVVTLSRNFGHPAALAAAVELAAGASLVVELPITLLLAYGSYRLVERPFLRARERLPSTQQEPAVRGELATLADAGATTGDRSRGAPWTP